jgi:hypothetical protein
LDLSETRHRFFNDVFIVNRILLLKLVINKVGVHFIPMETILVGMRFNDPSPNDTIMNFLLLFINLQTNGIRCDHGKYIFCFFDMVQTTIRIE